jgi:hypothetical protein
MTFAAAPWAVDGARTGAALARRASFAALSESEGIVGRADLKVSELSVPGNGLLISAGNAVILNRYQDSPNESYVAANEGVHEVLSTEMPGAQATPKSYLVLVTIGDKEFSQVGHPWMDSEVLDPAEAADYVYVRPFILECPAGTKSFAELNLDYPAIALARLDIPASTTTITNAMITDLRKLARPRVHEELIVVNGFTASDLDTVSPSWEVWPAVSQAIDIPAWASVAKINGFFESAMISKAIDCAMRVAIVGGSNTSAQRFNRSAPTAGSDRAGMNIAGTINVASIAGTTKTFRMEGQTITSASNDGLTADGLTSASLRIRFEEAPV